MKIFQFFDVFRFQYSKTSTSRHINIGTIETVSQYNVELQPYLYCIRPRKHCSRIKKNVNFDRFLM